MFEVNELYEYGRLVSVVLGNFILIFSNILYVYIIYFTYQYLFVLFLECVNLCTINIVIWSVF